MFSPTAWRRVKASRWQSSLAAAAYTTIATPAGSSETFNEWAWRPNKLYRYAALKIGISGLSMTMDEIVISLATALNRARSLTDEESGWLEQSIRREGRKDGFARSFWSEAQDSLLTPFVSETISVAESARIALRLGKSVDAVHSRIRLLRRRAGVRMAPRCMGRVWGQQALQAAE